MGRRINLLGLSQKPLWTMYALPPLWAIASYGWPSSLIRSNQLTKWVFFLLFLSELLINLFARRLAVLSWFSRPTSALRFINLGSSASDEPGDGFHVGLSRQSPRYLYGYWSRRTPIPSWWVRGRRSAIETLAWVAAQVPSHRLHGRPVQLGAG